MTITFELVDKILNTSYEDIPESVRIHAKKSLFNWLGVTIGAINHPSIQMMIDMVEELESAPQVTVLGRKAKVDMLSAVLINGASSHVFDYDDTHLDTILHPSGPVAPIVFALGEKFGFSTKDLIRAFILGCEVELRISNAVYPSHYRLGYHSSSSVGVFGAATAASILLNLDREKVAMALGLAGTQSFGLREMFGTMAKPFHPGKASQNGLMAALLVQKGFTSSTQVLEAKCGFLNVMSPTYDVNKVLIDWGNEWEFEKNAFKPYACGIVLHPSIDACIQLSKLGKMEDVKEIFLRVNPYVLELTGKETPTTGLEGKFSIYHTGAIAFLEGDASENEYNDELVNAERTVAFRSKINPIPDKDIRKDKVEATLELVNGEKHRVYIEHATGSIENPMTQAMIIKKFTKLTKNILSPQQMEEVIRLTMNLDELNSIHPVLQVLE